MVPNEAPLQVTTVRAFKEGIYTSERACTADFKVDPTILRRRLKEQGESYSAAYQNAQKLSVTEESFMVLRIITEDRQRKASEYKVSGGNN